jgi:hypothetical protein
MMPQTVVAQPGAAGTSQMETARPKPSPMHAVMFVSERMEEEASLIGAVIGQASAPVPPTPNTVGGAVPEKVLP